MSQPCGGRASRFHGIAWACGSGLPERGSDPITVRAPAVCDFDATYCRRRAQFRPGLRNVVAISRGVYVIIVRRAPIRVWAPLPLKSFSFPCSSFLMAHCQPALGCDENKQRGSTARRLACARRWLRFRACAPGDGEARHRAKLGVVLSGSLAEADHRQGLSPDQRGQVALLG